jgi:hypothetical protein
MAKTMEGPKRAMLYFVEAANPKKRAEAARFFQPCRVM